jgi:hypothetical protein
MIKDKFAKFKYNIYSQRGEDGIIKKILSKLKKEQDYTLCEFGASNGIEFSNSYNLIKNNNYSGLLIESSKKKFDELCKNIPDNKVIKRNLYIESKGKNSLDQILKRENFNINFDFLSIDIDGCDYYIFKNLKNYRPKIICIEFNPSIPNDIEFIQKEESYTKQGSSILSIAKLAENKKYSIITATECNLFLINNKYKKKVLGKNQIKIDHIRNDNKCKNYLFFGYDGSVHLSTKNLINWHGIQIINLKLLPKFLQKYPPDYNRLELMFFYLFKFIKNPKKYLFNIKKYI